MRIEDYLNTCVNYKPSFIPNYIKYASFCPLRHKLYTIKTLSKRVFTHCSLPQLKTEETQNIIKTYYHPTTFLSDCRKHQFNNPKMVVKRVRCPLLLGQPQYCIKRRPRTFAFETI
ncbi:hypothetical protein LAZ67_4002819 [Cordylochernes scorpioides]|uniref:Uncharacterized protein n=1 Tax=Cordylochernes scorpioides TaxID=51811 RepID=A0ABY6KEC7_9ARAC|nr:hypothetical protein LAZ67_4002819 [Cordylochernes scorpioides]